jgi:hypothetical protein
MKVHHTETRIHANKKLTESCVSIGFLGSSSYIFAGIAQTVEHLICNQAVTGSIPVSGSSFAQMGERLKPTDCKSVPLRRFGGSNPSLCTKFWAVRLVRGLLPCTQGTTV